MTTFRKLPQMSPNAIASARTNQRGTSARITRGSRYAKGTQRTVTSWHFQGIRGIGPVLISINPLHPEPRKVRRAVDALEAGEIIAYPTDTVYGLGCDVFNKRAVERLYAIKRMDRSHPLAFICPDLGNIARYAIVENAHYRVLRRMLP